MARTVPVGPGSSAAMVFRRPRPSSTTSARTWWPTGGSWCGRRPPSPAASANLDAGLKGGGAAILNLDGTHRRSLLSESGNFDAATGVIGGMSIGAVQCSVAGDEVGDALRALGGGADAAMLLAGQAMLRRRRRTS